MRSKFSTICCIYRISSSEIKEISTTFGTYPLPSFVIEIQHHIRYIPIIELTYERGADFWSPCSIFGVYQIRCYISISEPDIRHLPDKVLNFDLRTRYSASTKWGVKFRSQSSIFGIYQISCRISISQLDIRCVPNKVLNFDLRAQHSAFTK